MNEQLVVKNFGPIKDATVDFKRVTVFIGPTGGGKSTLAKLAAIFRNVKFHYSSNNDFLDFKQYSITSFLTTESIISWFFGNHETLIKKKEVFFNKEMAKNAKSLFNTESENLIKDLVGNIAKTNPSLLDKAHSVGDLENEFEAVLERALNTVYSKIIAPSSPLYIPSERTFLPAIEYSWAGLMRDDIGLPQPVLDFANSFSLSRKTIGELAIPFLNAIYIHSDGHDYIKIPQSETLFRLYETASGIQSVTPLLVLLEHLSRNTEQAQSFIIEEPELNLFPTAQFELVKTLVEKCARLDGKNDLVLTTHSPYVLTALNLMCYAFRTAQQDEATAKKVDKLIPRHCWIDPEQFAAYYVYRPDTKRKQQVRSIISKKTGLIEENELDTASDELSDIFDKLVRLRKPVKATAFVK